MNLLGGPRRRLETGNIVVQAKPLRCQSNGSGKGSRTAAWCSLGRVDLSCAMVRGGYSLRYTQPEAELQLLIQQLKLNLPPQPPPRISATAVLPK